MSEFDTLFEIIRRAPSDEEARARAEQQFGGDRLYVPRRLGKPSVQFAAQAKRFADVTDARQLARMLGCSYRQARRIIKANTPR